MAESDWTAEHESGFQGARGKIVEGATQYADTFDNTRGMVLTGWVVIFELADLEGGRGIYWLSGNGADPSDKAENGLSAWAIEGMLRKVIHESRSNSVRREGDGE